MTFPVFAGSNPSGYNFTRSLRLRSSASAYLNKTYSATQTNAKIQTFSWWTKRGVLSAVHDFFGAYDGTSATAFTVYFAANDTFNFDFGGASTNTLTTTQVFRDPSAWYHFVLAIDTTQATASNRYKLYVNGTQITAFSTANYVAQNADSPFGKNNANNRIGTNWNNNSQFLDGYLAEVNFIDGQALTPSSFGSTNPVTGVWQPARYAGTYGTNGFYLPFTDNSALTTSSNVGLGKDFSGNGNYWTTNNISITSGTTYDSMTDVPTLTSATAANFAVLNPLDSNLNSGTGALSSANLKLTTTLNDWASSRATISIPSGKWYWEVTRTLGNYGTFGIYVTNAVLSKDVNTSSNYYGYNSNGQKFSGGSGSSYGSSMATGDVIGVAFDASAGSLTFYLNNVSQGVAFTGITGSYSPVIGTFWNTSANDINFGQRPFSYTPPTGYVALNTYNLPTSTIVKGNTVMDATIWTGDGSSPRTITNSAGFKPDLVWAKNRSTSGYWNVLFDSVRGAGNQLSSNQTDAELASASNVAGKVSAFNSNGFSLETGSSSIRSVNGNTETYVGWQWQAGQGTTSSNTSGTITSSVSVNASAGFSVVTYTGNGSVSTIGHGLGVAPSLIIVKRRDSTSNWNVYHASVGATGVLLLNLTDTTATTSVAWNNTAPTSSVFTVGTGNDVNASGGTFVAYCFASIAGFSSFANYTGNGSTDGVFVYTGFRPKFVMIKRTNVADNWYINDSVRNPTNVTGLTLLADSSNAEANYSPTIDILSNGFKVRQSGAGYNASGGNYVYTCWAETPFKNALAR